MRFGVAVPPCDDARSIAALGARAEELGYDTIWLPDAQLLMRDVFITMALIADRTSSIRIASGVSNTTTRHPTVVASAANTLNEMAPGRITIGLGTSAGFGQLIGLPSVTRAALRADILQVRALMDGDWWDYDGRKARLIGAGGRVPMFIAAGGPKMATLAGEIADGVLLSVGATPAVIEEMMVHVDAGLEAAGRTRDNIEVVLSGFLHLTDDVERDAALFKPMCCLLARGEHGRQYLADAGVEIGDLDSLPPIYPSVAHAEDWEEAVRVASTVISDEAAMLFAQKFGLFGTIEEVAAKVATIEAAGIDHLFIRTTESYALPHEELEEFARVVVSPARPA